MTFGSCVMPSCRFLLISAVCLSLIADSHVEANLQSASPGKLFLLSLKSVSVSGQNNCERYTCKSTNYYRHTETPGEYWSQDDVDSWCNCHQHCRESNDCHYWNWYHTGTNSGLCALFSKIDGTEEGAQDLYSGVKRCDETTEAATAEAPAEGGGEEIFKVSPSVSHVTQKCSSTSSTIWDKVRLVSWSPPCRRWWHCPARCRGWVSRRRS